MIQELRERLDRLRSVLAVIDAQGGEASLDAVTEDVCMAVDDVRRSLWGVLTTTQAADAEEYVNSVRIRRAVEACSALAADARRGALRADNDEVADLRKAISELQRTLTEGSS